MGWWLAVAVPVAARGTQAGPELQGITRIYVQAFANGVIGSKLRDAVVGRLRMVQSLSLVATVDQANATLAGSGEIWLSSYRSLNPRSGRLPANGTALYTGFLSVELLDAKGETLWSYLAAETSSEHVEIALSKRIVSRLAEALHGSETP